MYFYMQVFIFVVFVTFCVFLDVFTQCAFWHQSKSLLLSMSIFSQGYADWGKNQFFVSIILFRLNSTKIRK